MNDTIICIVDNDISVVERDIQPYNEVSIMH